MLGARDGFPVVREPRARGRNRFTPGPDVVGCGNRGEEATMRVLERTAVAAALAALCVAPAAGFGSHR